MGRDGVLLPQLGALGDSEAVLFVNDDQPDVLEIDIIFQQGVCPDEDLQAAVLQAAVNLLAFFLAAGAGQQGDIDIQGGKHLADGVIMLCRKNFGGSHQASLVAIV